MSFDTITSKSGIPFNKISNKPLDEVMLDNDPSLTANSDTKIATQQATKTFINNALATKQNIITQGNLSESTSSVLTITGGTNAVIGSGTSVQVKQATSSQSGFLANADWNTFNNKQAPLGFTPENISNKSNSFTVTSTTTYPNTKALVDGLATKQNTLVSGTNIKTVNSESLLGAGNILISGATWGSITGTLASQTDLQSALNSKTKVLATKVGVTSFPSSTSENSLIGTLIGTNTIPANSMVIGKTYRLSIGGFTSATAAGGQILNLKLGSTTLLSFVRSDLITAGFAFQFLLTCITTGSSGSIMVQPISNFWEGFGGYPYNVDTYSIDTTINQAIDVTYRTTTSDVNNFGCLTNLCFEELN